MPSSLPPSLEPERRPILGGATLILLDVEAADLDDALAAVGKALEREGRLEGDYKHAVLASLRRHGDSGPEALEAGVAILHERVRRVAGPPIDVLVRTREPLPLADARGEETRFIWVLLSNERTHPHVNAAAELALLMHEPGFAAMARAARTPEELVALVETALEKQLRFEATVPELRATGTLFGGIRADLARRRPHWADDWRAGLHPKVLASILFMYAACLAVAVAFGALVSTLTGGQIGVVETLLASAVCGVLWATFAGQPLAIIGATGPNVIFTGILYTLTVQFDVPFLPTVAWTGLWAGLFMVVLAATDASALIRYFTRFTDEIFALLIAFIYIWQAVEDLVGLFAGDGVADDTALLSLLLALGTFGIAIGLSRFRRSPYLRAKVREFLSDFGPSIAIVSMTLVAVWMHRVELATLDVPASFAPTMDRDWLVSPFDAPMWVWVASAIPAMLLTILIWTNQNITARLANSPDNKLVKGPAFHWDIAVIGALVALMGLFGLPWVVGAAVRTLNHVKSLIIERDGRVVGNLENRVSNFGIHALIGLSILLFLPVLANVPMAVLYGLFLFMGFGTLGGNQFVRRLRLWIMDPEQYSPTHYLRAVPTRIVHKYTGVQLLCFAVLWAVKMSAIAILFPLFVALLVPVRMFISRYFSPSHLGLLDAEETPADEEFREAGT